MDVKLPNGVVIKGVPEGTPKHVVAMKAIQKGLAKNEDFGYDSGVTKKDLEGGFVEGVGAGLTNVARRGANLLLPDSLTPEWASDEAIAEQSEIDRDLLTSGKVGKFAGEMVGTAPLGAGAATGAARLTSRAAPRLSKALAKGAPRFAVEGATVGSVLANPEDRTAGALLGAATGGAFAGAGNVLGKALGKSSMVKITKEADELQKLTGQFIPLSQSAEDGLTKQFYNAFLANMPGVAGKIRGQYDEALDDLRKFATEKALPDTSWALNKANLSAKDTLEETFTKLDDYWKTAFDEIKPIPIRVFSDVYEEAPAVVKRALKDQIEDGVLKLPRTGDQITGADVLSLKTALGEVYSTAAKAQKPQVMGYMKSLDKLLDRNLNPTGKGKGMAARVLNEYRENQNAWGSWQALVKARAKAKNNMDFTPQQLGKAAKATKQGSLNTAQKTDVQRAGELGVDALENFPSRQGLFQTLAATSPVLAAGGAVAGGAGVTGAGLALLGAIVGGRIAASKGLQKYLSGQTKFQRMNKAIMKKYENELRRLGLSASDAAVVLGAQDAS